MKVLLVHDTGTPSGGAEQQLLVLRDGLRRRGHTVRLLTSRARLGPGRLPADFTCFGSTGVLQTPVRLANPSAVLHLARALRVFRPDVVHVKMFLQQLSPLVLPLLRGVPSLYHAALYEAVCPTAIKLLPDGRQCTSQAGLVCLRGGCLSPQAWGPLMLQRALWRHWRGAFDLVVANSSATRRLLLEDGLGPVEVAHNGIPSAPARPPLSDPPTVAFAGRLVREKGLDVLLRAFAHVVAELPEARLLVAGDGPERQRAEHLAATLGLSARTSLLGYVPYGEVARCLASAWVQAVPSVWEEPFGLVAAEAMMRGTAVVASAAGGLPEIVRDGREGILVPPGDVGTLGKALVTLLANRTLAERMGAAARVRVLAEFGEERFVDRFESLYRTLIGRVRADGP